MRYTYLLCAALILLLFSVSTFAQAHPPIDVTKINVDRLAPDLLNLAVVLVFVILLMRTAAPLIHSRYLRHLAGAYGLIGLFYVSAILLVQYKLILFFSAQA